MSLVEFLCKKIEINGTVQGVGFRPFIYNLAVKHNLKGYVLNSGSGVEIEVEGLAQNIECFILDISKNLPPLAKIDNLLVKESTLKNYNSFIIKESISNRIFTSLVPDIAMCDDCKNELKDPTNRRYNYPFINCTNCGVRYSITKSLPYDRKNTTMHKFTMCKECQKEYNDPTNRRYHAQPISCHNCGVQLVGSLDSIVEDIKNGKIVAIKGVGGFHIVCDATNYDAVAKLRERKNRPSKPFGVIFLDTDAIKLECELSEVEEQFLNSKERPIVLLKKSKNYSLASNVAPNIDLLGAFLPYTPLHLLLLEKLQRPIVATSANLSGEPIISDDKQLLEKLSHVVDSVLSYNRDIQHSGDDSVMMVVDNKAIFFRVSRGYVPKSIYLKNKTQKKILSVGANQKSNISFAFEDKIIHVGHLGDLDSIESVEYFKKAIFAFEEFYSFKPDLIVHDKHPEYESTKFAKSYAKELGIRSLELQHHYAHALSVMAEYDLDEEVLAFCFDGTGLGDDGVIWGSEVFLATPKEYKRIYHLDEFLLLGAQKAIKEPKRVALSLLFEFMSFEEIQKLPISKSFSSGELKTLYMMHKKGLNSIKTTSMGRVFDAVYALMGYYETIGFEGESGFIVQSLAQKTTKLYSYTLRDDGIIDIKNMIKEMLCDTKVEIASKFINTIADIVEKIALKHKDKSVVLSGGVFQNRVLLENIVNRFKKYNIKYYLPQTTAINDGGISLGQVYYAIKKDKYD